MKNPFFYILLAVLVLLTGWLMSHPNLIGRAGIFFYEYTYLETFPRALGTVAVVVGGALLVAKLMAQLSKPMALPALTLLLLAGSYWLTTSVIQFNSGLYKLTGAGFRAGAIMLPGLVTLVIGKTLFDRMSQRK